MTSTMPLTRNKALQILGFTSNSKPTFAEIKESYKALSLLFHPDKNRTFDTKEKFQSIATAYEFLNKAREIQDRVSTWAGMEDFTDSLNFLQTFIQSQPPVNNSPANERSENIYRILITTVVRENNLKLKKSTVMTYSLMNEEAFLQQCEANFKNIISLKIPNLLLPRSATEIILSHLLANKKLLKAAYPVDFFNEYQIKRLADHLQDNNKIQVEARYKKLGKYIGMPVSVGSIIYLGLYGSFNKWGPFFWSVTKFAVVESIRSAVVVSYVIYQALAAAFFYNNAEKIQAIKSPREKNALLTGLKVKDCSSYFKSFGSLSTYRHPIAFAAGMSFAMNNDHIMKRIIKTNLNGKGLATGLLLTYDPLAVDKPRQKVN